VAASTAESLADRERALRERLRASRERLESMTGQRDALQQRLGAPGALPAVAESGGGDDDDDDDGGNDDEDEDEDEDGGDGGDWQDGDYDEEEEGDDGDGEDEDGDEGEYNEDEEEGDEEGDEEADAVDGDGDDDDGVADVDDGYQPYAGTDAGGGGAMATTSRQELDNFARAAGGSGGASNRPAPAAGAFSLSTSSSSSSSLSCGSCEDMCPPEERQKRIDESDVHRLEYPPGWAPLTHQHHLAADNTRATMVKKFQRSSADHELLIPHLIRTPAALYRTICYMEEHVMERHLLALAQPADAQALANERERDRVTPLFVYLFVWDRYRMVAKDFILQARRPARTTLLRLCSAGTASRSFVFVLPLLPFCPPVVVCCRSARWRRTRCGWSATSAWRAGSS